MMAGQLGCFTLETDWPAWREEAAGKWTGNKQEHSAGTQWGRRKVGHVIFLIPSKSQKTENDGGKGGAVKNAKQKPSSSCRRAGTPEY